MGFEPLKLQSGKVLGCKNNILESFRKQNGYGTHHWTVLARVDCMFKVFLHWSNQGRQRKKKKITTYGM